MAVTGGLFWVELDFGAAVTSADFMLQIGARPGTSTGSFTTLSPTTNLRPAPQAQIAGIAGEAVTVSPNAITSASILDGTVTGTDIQDGSVSGADVQDASLSGTDVQNGSLSGVDIQDESLAGTDVQDGSITTNDIADGTILAIDVNTSLLQARVNNTCATGSAIREINQGGGVTCETIPAGNAGTITGVTAGTGLSGGGSSGNVTVNIANDGVASAQIANGSVGSADINTAQVQQRVTGLCAFPQFMASVNADGSVVCRDQVIVMAAGAQSVLVYRNATTGNLLMKRCGSFSSGGCNTGTGASTAVGDGGVAEVLGATILNDNRPMILFRNTTPVTRVVTCPTANCAAFLAPTTVFNLTSETAALSVGSDGLPFIFGISSNGPQRYLVNCGLQDCTGSVAFSVGIFASDMAGTVGLGRTARDYPYLVFTQGNTVQIQVCENRNCDGNGRR